MQYAMHKNVGNLHCSSDTKIFTLTAWSRDHIHVVLYYILKDTTGRHFLILQWYIL